MTSLNEYTDEQLNYYRICYVTTDILAEGLREIFKQEWDKLYKSTKGEWKDEPRNGMDFYHGESPRNQKRKARLLATMKNGNSGEWDCTMLFYAILFSDCVGPGLSAIVRENVDDLRNFRNEEFAHMPRGSLPEIDFQNAISKVAVAFQALSLSTVKIQDLECQKTFPTKDLTKVLKEVDNLKLEVQEKESQRQVLEDQLQNEAPSFCVLPPKPSHEIGGREREVAKIVQQLRELNESTDNRLSYLYISGNPGSGKSQLAGLVAERFFDDLKEMPGGSSFVMTLNAASLDSLLESYASFARHLKCPDYSIVETLSSKNSTVDEKITSLKMLVAVKITCYTSWLLVVDNVTTMSSVHAHLPQFNSKAWERGHLLITTQDTTSIPSKSSFVNHISVSQGMEPDDARSLLSKLSGIPDSELGGTVAQRLDYQPLALAGAAAFVKEIRQDKVSTHFGWEEYLKILEKGKRQETENTLVDTNPIYPYSMTGAITLAVETLMRSDKVQKHLFTFLALCAPRPLNMDIAVSYIMNAHEEFGEADKELIRMRLKRSSLLLFQDDEVGCFIRVHQVVHDVIKTVAKEYAESQTDEVVSGVITAFDEFIVATPPENKRLNTRHIAPHLKALTTVTDKVFLRDNFFQVHEKEISKKCQHLGNICQIHCEFEEAKTYFKYSLTFTLQELGPEHVDVATNYNNLALIYQDLGDFEQAKEYEQRALDIRVDKLGPEHVDVARSYGNLASIYRDLGDFEQAKEYQERALAIRADKHWLNKTPNKSLQITHETERHFSQSKKQDEDDEDDEDATTLKLEDDLNAEETSSKDEDELPQEGRGLKDLWERDEEKESWDEDEDEDSNEDEHEQEGDTDDDDEDEDANDDEHELEGDDDDDDEDENANQEEHEHEGDDDDHYDDNDEDEDGDDQDEMTRTSALFLQAKAKKRSAGAGKGGLFSEEEIPESKRPRLSPVPLSGGLGQGSGTSTPILTGNEKSRQGSKKVPHK